MGESGEENREGEVLTRLLHEEVLHVDVCSGAAGALTTEYQHGGGLGVYGASNGVLSEKSVGSIAGRRLQEQKQGLKVGTNMYISQAEAPIPKATSAEEGLLRPSSLSFLQYNTPSQYYCLYVLSAVGYIRLEVQ